MSRGRRILGAGYPVKISGGGYHDLGPKFRGLNVGCIRYGIKNRTTFLGGTKILFKGVLVFYLPSRSNPPSPLVINSNWSLKVVFAVIEGKPISLLKIIYSKR